MLFRIVDPWVLSSQLVLDDFDIPVVLCAALGPGCLRELRQRTHPQ
jgi:hypothetical protein